MTNSIPVNYEQVLARIAYNNTYCPEIDNVIYNIGYKTYPKRGDNGKMLKDENGKIIYGEPVKTLTTVVFFDDSTKVTVTNSEGEGLTFEDKHSIPGDPNSPVVTVATDISKEMGLVYAIVKRIIGKIDAKDHIDGDGMGRKLRNVVTSAYDTVQEAAANKYKKTLAQKEHARKLAEGKKNKPRPSFAETVVDLRKATDNLMTLIEALNLSSYTTENTCKCKPACDCEPDCECEHTAEENR